MGEWLGLLLSLQKADIPFLCEGKPVFKKSV